MCSDDGFAVIQELLVKPFRFYYSRSTARKEDMQEDFLTTFPHDFHFHVEMDVILAKHRNVAARRGSQTPPVTRQE